MLDATCTCPDSLDYDGGVACEYQKEQTMDDIIEITIVEQPITLGEYLARGMGKFFMWKTCAPSPILMTTNRGYVHVTGEDSGRLFDSWVPEYNVIPCDIDGNPLENDGGWKTLKEIVKPMGGGVQLKVDMIWLEIKDYCVGQLYDFDGNDAIIRAAES